MINLVDSRNYLSNGDSNSAQTVRKSIPIRNALRTFRRPQLSQIPQLALLPKEISEEIDLLARVLPFKVNQYVTDQLIDWKNVPNDPIYRLTFPQPEMLRLEDRTHLRELINKNADDEKIDGFIKKLRLNMNPHPADQKLNAPVYEGEVLEGLQHKYAETVLFFPSQGQTCHAYCTFCFRWPQFVDDFADKFASSDCGQLHDYLRLHGEVSDLLLTGGDPMVMNARRLREYLEPLLDPDLNHIKNIRIGTKSLTYWPYRFISDNDTAELFSLFRKLIDGGKNVTIMAHLNHWKEISTEAAQEAIFNLRKVGIVIRSQGPILKNINDSADIWKKNWSEQVRLGIVPYYMFVERDTGPREYFQLPLAQALNIYNESVSSVSGLARTARGPSMSTGPGKVEVSGTIEISKQKYFLLNFIQARNISWLRKPFLAKYSETACWLDQLSPPEGQQEFFFQKDYSEFVAQNSRLLGELT